MSEDGSASDAMTLVNLTSADIAALAKWAIK